MRATVRARSYIFQRKPAGKQVRVTIGDCASWGIDQARAEAKRLSILIDQGIDPRQEKAERLRALDSSWREQERATVALATVWEAYTAARAQDWSEAHRRDHEQAMTAPGWQIDRKRNTKAGRSIRYGICASRN
ncbi:Arm DNA-binding domain-containing protein [Thioalkalivibrio versutus]|uniref:Arm DNA-binding domain-containing protein n=1 Tax=Thioalkalivibrio versutus TaxID=106634 RepID=UPI0022B8EAA5|nr:Arm DNA-binding domain-containing protein [Thioalkalivibrio versutus]